MSEIELRLLQSMMECVDAFKSVVAILDRDRPEITNFGFLRTAWDDYYFNKFLIFDLNLKTYIEEGGDQYENILPISISHHNLHILIKVLSRDIEGETLGNAHIPERIIDLIEIFKRLDYLLEETGRNYAMENDLVKITSAREVDARLINS